MGVPRHLAEESVQMNNLYVLNRLPSERTSSFGNRMLPMDIGVNRSHGKGVTFSGV
ncbi:hypothetical protein M422DRAFT_35864 [Sphaerobolus stellatus SS14]|uniref:Uncharacterized protein n=1 Tax=Sphaerobolus stellatus (strain SS14) TaxID=990650 RepID=A0A0C9V4H1_SPHS4|nr:hypothetical protein M422DRAFT_35864 [Sphaerobolus stellatus SS14]